MIEKKLEDIMTTIETLSGFAIEDCLDWVPEDGMNIEAEAFLHVIFRMAHEGRQWCEMVREAAEKEQTRKRSA